MDRAHLQVAAKVMAKRRPDLWTEKQARQVILVWKKELDEFPDSIDDVGTGGFFLRKTVSDRYTAYSLMQGIMEFEVWKDGVTDNFSWVDRDATV